MILTPLQKKFLEEFFRTFLGEKFFLSGGTALAEFYLKHRLSQDLDLFTIDQTLGFDSVNTEINKIANNLDLIIEHQISSPSFLQYVFNHKGEALKDESKSARRTVKCHSFPGNCIKINLIDFCSVV